MSIDAQHWVWFQSRLRGNARLVLLACADKATGPDCKARIGMTELQKRLGDAPKSTVVAAVDKALDSGELVIDEPAAGSRATRYCLPYAVGYVRPAPGSRGPDSRPLDDGQGSGFPTGSDPQGSENPTSRHMPSGRESGPGGSEKPTTSGRESGPLYQTTPTRSGSKQAREPAPAPLPELPEFALPLIEAMNNASPELRTLRWNLNPTEWATLHALIKRSGIPALATFAARQAARTEITYARYFLSGWRDLPPAPAGPPEPRLRAVATNGPARHTPYQNPAADSAYQNGW